VPGVETSSTVAAGIDLSTVPKVKTYLRSLGVDTRGLVIQHGLKNYAGPNCPGAAWNCTTASKVVQLSLSGDDGGENRFVCKPQSARVPPTNGATNTCVIVQGPNNSTNSATCDLADSQPDGTIMQTCFATQTGKKNSFFARQVAVMGDDDTDQDVFQTISVKQTSSGTGGNTLETIQVANLGDNGNSPTAAVFQDVHQLTCGNQIASGSGPNVAKSGQTQSLSAEKQGAALGSINQNTDAGTAAICTGPAVPFDQTAFPDIVPPHDMTDCAIDTANSQAKESANACTRIQQVSGSGRNTIRLNQVDLLEAEVDATAGTVDVTQGNLSPFTTGTDATLDQASSAGGLSQIFDGGLTRYDADITTGGVATVFLEQNDTGPRCCAGGHQFGNPGNDFLIGQIMSLKARVDGELVDPNLGSGFVDQFGIVYADCETSGIPSSNGGCVVGQLASNNVDTDTRQCGPSQSCHVFIRCTAFGGDGGSFFAIGIQQVVTGDCASDDELTFAVRR
jgi:hypothetical protein